MDYSARPKYHYKPKKGWINDPNGLVYFDGYYHLFYQHCPDYEANTQPMHWGHARTKDFVHYEELPIALYPDKDYDAFGCWSGTAIVKDDVLYLDIVPIARYAGIVVSGSDASLKLTAHDGSSIRFENGANYAYVDSDKVRLEGMAKIQLLDGEDGENISCLIPFSFIERMFACEVEKGTPSVRVRLNTKTNEILIRQVVYTSSGKPLPVRFSVDCFDVIAN